MGKINAAQAEDAIHAGRILACALRVCIFVGKLERERTWLMLAALRIGVLRHYCTRPDDFFPSLFERFTPRARYAVWRSQFVISSTLVYVYEFYVAMYAA
jgi:hypothetical protein